MRFLEDGVQSLLLAIDFSQPSKRAFDAAVRMARVFGAKLHILHVNEEESIFGVHDSADLAHFMDHIARRRAEWMSSFEARATELGIDAASTLRDGDPADTILDVADTLDAGMIVLGTHGTRGITSLLPGSVAKKVMRRAERPVLAVSRMAGVAPAEAGGTFEKIAYPTDLSEASRAGIGVARMLADRTDARITLVHIIRLPRVIPGLPGEAPIVIPAKVVAQLELRRRAELEELSAGGGDAKIDYQLATDADPAEGICSLAGQAGFDLIVMPRHSKHRVGSYFFGHTAESVAKIAPVPVLLFSPRAV